MGLGIGRGLVGLFKQWGKGIGNAADNFWLGADAQKAIRDEVTKKFQPKIDLAYRAESRRAKNIKDLDDKVTQSKEELANAQKVWQDKYDAELAAAQTQRQTDIADYNKQLQAYSDALAQAKAGRQSIVDQLRDSEAHYDPSRTMFTDVNTGKNYIFDPINGGYRSLDSLTKKERKRFLKNYGNFDSRLIDFNTNPSGRIINAFDKSDMKQYGGKSSFFDSYYSNRISTQNAALRDANNQIKLADADLQSWRKQPQSQLKNWGIKDLRQFEQNFEKNNNVKPTEYSFNGQNYKSKSGLERAYKDAKFREQNRKDLYGKTASGYASKRDAEIAQRIQDAKDINKAKVALGLGTAGALAGATYAAFSGDDTDNTNNINNGEPDPNFNIKNTPEVQAQLNDEQQPDTAPINTGFDPDKADALAAAAYDKGVEDSNSIESSGDLGNNIAANTGGHTIDDGLSADDIHTNEGIGTRRSMNEGLFSVIKALQDPHQANAVADYIYSRYGNDPELQQLGWRAWLNKYYGDALRSQMNLDASGYNGMHIA